MQIPGYSNNYPNPGYPYGAPAPSWANPAGYPGQASMPSSPGFPPGMPPNALLPMQQAYREAVQDIMKSPEKRREFMSIVEDMQSGKLSPQGLGQRMSRLLANKTRKPEDKPSPLQSLSVVGIATAAGIGLGALVRRAVGNLEQTRTSTSERLIRGVDRIPGLSSVSQGLERYMDRVAAESKSHPSLLLNLDGSYYSPSELRKIYVQRQFGRTGFQAEKLAQMRVQLRPYLTSGQINAIIKSFHRADRYSALQQIMQPELQHFIPDSLHAVMPSLGEEFKHLKLWQVDQHSAKNYFLRKLGEATYEQQVNAKLARQLFEDIKKSRMPFADFYEKQLVRKPQYANMMKDLFRTEAAPASYQALRDKLGLKPFWTYLNESTTGLLYKGKTAIPLGALPSSTLHDLEKRIVRSHIAGQLKLIPAWQSFEKQIRGVMLRANGFESMSMPILESEYMLMRSLKNRGIGPVGRLAGKLWFNLNQMFSSSNFQRWTVQQTRSASKGIASLFTGGSGLGRALLPFMIFGLAAQTGMNTNKENRKAKLADQLALGLGGFYGFTLAMSLLPRLPLPKSMRFLNRLNMAKMPLLPFTWGGFMEYMVIGTILANYVSNAFQWPVHKIFGKPAKEDDDAKSAAAQAPGGSNPLEAIAALSAGGADAMANAFPPQGLPTSNYYPNSQGYPTLYNYPSASPSGQSPASAPLAMMQAMKVAPIAAKAVAKKTAEADAASPTQPEAQVLYSTAGLKPIAQLIQNPRQQREKNREDQMMKDLRKLQRELS